jgi:hypothetical protein
MQFRASFFSLTVALAMAAQVSNASLVSSTSQESLMKRDETSQPHLQKRFLRGLGSQMVTGAAVGAGASIGGNIMSSLWKKGKALWQGRNGKNQVN